MVLYIPYVRALYSFIYRFWPTSYWAFLIGNVVEYTISTMLALVRMSKIPSLTTGNAIVNKKAIPIFYNSIVKKNVLTCNCNVFYFFFEKKKIAFFSCIFRAQTGPLWQRGCRGRRGMRLWLGRRLRGRLLLASEDGISS